MGEIIAFSEHYSFSNNGIILVCKEWLSTSQDKWPKVIADLAIEVKRYWMAISSDPKAEIDEAPKFGMRTEELFKQLSKYTPMSELEFRQNNDPVWEMLSAQNGRVQMRINPLSSGKLRQSCKQNLVKIMERSNGLYLHLRRYYCSEDPDIVRDWTEYDVVNHLYPNRPDDTTEYLTTVHLAVADVLKGMTKGSDEVKRLKDDVAEILGITLIGIVDDSSREELFDLSKGVIDKCSFDMAERGEVVVEASFSTLGKDGAHVPKLDLCRQGYFFQVNKRERDYRSRKQEVKFTVDSTVDQIIIMIWNFTCPDASYEKPSWDTLSDSEEKELNNDLASAFERGRLVYFIAAVNDNNIPLNDGVLSALKFRLPYLFIFRTGVSGGVKVLSGEFRDRYVSTQCKEFGELFRGKLDD